MTPQHHTPDPGNAASIISAMERLNAPTSFQLPGTNIEIIAAPSGIQLHSLKPFADKYLTAPEQLIQTVALSSIDALIGYTNRFRAPNTLAFYDTPTGGTPTMLVALDYHHASDEIDDLPPSATHVNHLATYHFPISQQLRDWIEFASDSHNSQEFAEFLLDRAADIESPPLDWMMVEDSILAEVCAAMNLYDDRVPTHIAKDRNGNYTGTEELAAEFGAADDSDDPGTPSVPRTAIYKLRKIRFASAHTISNLARSVEINSESRAKAHYDPKSGATSLVWEESSNAQSKSGAPVKLPDGFFLYIPVFEGEPPRLIPCRLKHRARGAVVWIIEIADVLRMITRAVDAAAARFNGETNVPVLRGLPTGKTMVEALRAKAMQDKLLA